MHPADIAIVNDGRSVSYAAFANAITSISDHCEQLSLAFGSTVIVLINDLLDCWVAVAALQSQGFITICVHSTASIQSLQLGPIAAILTTERECANHKKEARSGTNGIVAIPQPLYDNDVELRVYNGTERRNSAGHIIYTSGTTGTYKKIFLPAANQKQRDYERIEWQTLSADTVYHAAYFGLWSGIGYFLAPSVWRVGGTVILDRRPDWPKHFLNSGVNYSMLTPEMVNELLAATEKLPAYSGPRLDFKLRVTGGFMSLKLAENIERRLTKSLFASYGSSEINIFVMESRISDFEDWHWLTPLSARNIEVVDTNGARCALGEEGLIRVMLTKNDANCYENNQKASFNVFKNGYFYPGDLAIRRADGRIRVLGRSADVLNIQGRKLAVAPIEQKIQQRLVVDQVCMFSGITHSGEEEIVIVLETQQWPEKKVLDALGVEIVQFDRVRFNILEQFPRTETGTKKVNRQALRKLVYPDE